MSTSSTFTATDGDQYEIQMGRWSCRLSEPFLDFTGVRDEERVLDVGCGTGSLTFAIPKRAKIQAAIGVDIAPAYVDHARRNNSDDRLEFRVGDGCAIPYPDNGFDRVLSLLVLMFVPQPQKMIAEMCRVARPGATVAAATWDFTGGFPRMFLDTAAVLDPKADQARARLFGRPMTRRGELANAWQSAGLTDVMETVATIRMEYQSFEDYWAPYVGGQGPSADYVGTLADAERSRLRDYVQLAYLGGNADGPRSYAASAWAVKGTKPV